MSFSIRIFIFVVGTLIFLIILELVRRRRFREELSIIWLIMGAGLIFGSFADLIIDRLASKLGVSYPPTLVFMIIFFLLVLVILYFSLVVSDLKSNNKELSQKIASIEYKLSELSQKKD